MVEGGSSEIMVRPTDGKAVARVYDDGVKIRARLYWCLGETDTSIERRMGFPAGVVRVWRHRKQPDGNDWHELKESLMLAPLDRVLSLVGPVDERELREEWLRQGQRLAGIAMAALEQGVLRDEAGNEVKWLWTEGGKKVRVGGIRPTTTTQVVAMLQLGQKLMEEQMEGLERVREKEELEKDGNKRWMGEIFAEMKKVLGAKAALKFEAYLRAGGDDGKGEDAVDGDLVDVEGTESITSEETEDGD